MVSGPGASASIAPSPALDGSVENFWIVLMASLYSRLAKAVRLCLEVSKASGMATPFWSSESCHDLTGAWYPISDWMRPDVPAPPAATSVLYLVSMSGFTSVWMLGPIHRSYILLMTLLYWGFMCSSRQKYTYMHVGGGTTPG